MSTLATRLRRKLARRQRLARWSKALVIPTVAAMAYLGRRNEWFGIAGFVLFFAEVIAIAAAESLRCPLCDTRLVMRHDWREELTSVCPECGFVID